MYPIVRWTLRYFARSLFENWKAPITRASPAKRACGMRNAIAGAKCRAISEVGFRISRFFMKVTKAVRAKKATKPQNLAREPVRGRTAVATADVLHPGFLVRKNNSVCKSVTRGS